MISDDNHLIFWHLQGVAGLEAFGAACPLGVSPSCGTPDHLAATNLHVALQQQQQQAALQMMQQPGLLPGATAALPQPTSNAQAAAMAQAAALMAGMQDTTAAASPGGFNMLSSMMPDAAANQPGQYQVATHMCRSMYVLHVLLHHLLFSTIFCFPK